MKLLLLVRHAKSSWKDPGLTDRDRPLNRRGIKDAPRMGKRLAEDYPAPDLVLSSPAVRALETAKAIANAIAYPVSHIRVEERLYGAGPDAFMRVIRELDDDADRVSVVGHNPTLTEVAAVLSRHPFGNVPTCGVVALTFETDAWDEVGRANVRLLEFDFPKKPRRGERS
jgi:phosphohistidine phosphatase